MRKYNRQPKTIIVTGGSSGIGLELAKLLAGEAAEIVLLARNQVKLSQAKTALEALNPSLEVFTISADLSTVEGIFQAIKQVEALHLNIDSLVNNVGYGVSGLADSLDLDTVEKATVQLLMLWLRLCSLRLSYLPSFVIRGISSLWEPLILCLVWSTILLVKTSSMVWSGAFALI